MNLVVDAGNSRVKWQLRSGDSVEHTGVSILDDESTFEVLRPFGSAITGVAVSTVASEEKRERLLQIVRSLTGADVMFHWAEAGRNGLVNSYADPGTMGADRWHAMYGAWIQLKSGFAVVDAGSAITIDFVANNGEHIGGYILPGQRMMLSSLRTDAARIGFKEEHIGVSTPGRSTTECVHHGRLWLWQAMIQQTWADCESLNIGHVLVTGGDAGEMAACPRSMQWPDLVLDGLAAIDAEERVQ